MQFTVSIPEVHYVEATIEGDDLQDALRKYAAGEGCPCYTGFSEIDRVLLPSRANPWYVHRVDDQYLREPKIVRSL